MLYCNSIRNLSSDKKPVIISRITPKGLNNKNILHLPNLAPSYSLLKDYNNARPLLKNGKKEVISENWFNNIYVDRFLIELANNKKSLEELIYLRDLSFKEDLELICYCTHENLCHRSIVIGILQGTKALVSGDIEDYSYYSDKFKRLKNQ